MNTILTTSQLDREAVSSISSITSSNSSFSKHSSPRRDLHEKKRDSAERDLVSSDIAHLESIESEMKKRKLVDNSRPSNAIKAARIYDAANARSDLEKSGTYVAPYLEIGNTGRSIDISKVDFLNSTQYSLLLNEKELQKGRETPVKDYCVIARMCHPFYATTSSMTSTKSYENSSEPDSDLTSDDGSGIFVNNQLPQPLATGYDDFFYDLENIGTIEQNKETSVSCSPSSVITLEQALALYPKPRVVTEAAAPFMVVHANAGYSRLTGKPSDALIGQPISALLGYSNNKQVSLSHCVSMSEIGNDVVVDVSTRPILKSSNNNESVDDNFNSSKRTSVRCFMTAFPVIQDKNSPVPTGLVDITPLTSSSPVTHFVLEMSVCQYSNHFMQQDATHAKNNIEKMSIAGKVNDWNTKTAATVVG